MTGGGLTRKADRPVDTFGQISSAVKVEKRQQNQLMEENELFSSGLAKNISKLESKNSILMDDKCFFADSSSFVWVVLVIFIAHLSKSSA